MESSVIVALYCLIALCAAACLGALGELAARWRIRRRGFYSIHLPGARSLIHADQRIFPGAATPVHWHVNRDGERGDEPPQSAKGLHRVLVAGGSIVECFILDQPLSFPVAIQGLLSEPENLRALGAERVHVGNIGRSGFDSRKVRLALERILPRHPHLDVIALLVGASDVLRWLAKEGPRHFDPGPPELAGVFACHPEGPFGWHPRKLALVELLRRRRARSLIVNHGAGKSLQKCREMRGRAKEMRPSAPNPAGLLDYFEENFRALVAVAKAHADRVLVVRQPWWDKKMTPEEEAGCWAAGVGEPWVGEVSVYYSFEVYFDLVRQLELPAMRVAEELGVEQMALMPYLERNTENFYDSLHLTRAGAARVAEAIAAALLRPPLLPTRPASSLQHEDDAVHVV